MKHLLLEHLFDRIAGPPVDEEQQEDRTAVLVARPRPLSTTGLTGDQRRKWKSHDFSASHGRTIRLWPCPAAAPSGATRWSNEGSIARCVAAPGHGPDARGARRAGRAGQATGGRRRRVNPASGGQPADPGLRQPGSGGAADPVAVEPPW